MKRVIIIPLVALIFLLPLLLLSACGGGGGGDGGGDSSASSGSSSSGSVATTLAGRVADGYLVDAKVFLDRNNNRTYDNGEPTVQTTAGGIYELRVNPGDGEQYPVVVQVIAGQTIDEDTNSPVDKGYSLESLPGHWAFVSPLTTMVALERGKNLLLTPQQAENIVRQRLGVPDVSFYTDYVAASSGDAADGDAQDYQRAHRVARVVASVMGNVQSVIKQKLDTPDPSVMAFMVSDQVLAQDHHIREALDVNKDISTLITTIVAGIDTGALDDALLQRYLLQVAAPPTSEGWDMQPPRPESKFPAPENTASIDSVISITFDEKIDTESIDDGTIEVIGSNGSIAGNLNYDVNSRRLTFTPSVVLHPFIEYRVTVSEGLTDMHGNPLSSDITWTFTTIFDQLPPVLPDFM